MQELGIQSFTLDDGSKIDVKPTYGAYIKLDDRPMAFEWLRDNGFDDIIKNTISSRLAAEKTIRQILSKQLLRMKGFILNRKKTFTLRHSKHGFANV